MLGPVSAASRTGVAVAVIVGVLSTAIGFERQDVPTSAVIRAPTFRKTPTTVIAPTLPAQRQASPTRNNQSRSAIFSPRVALVQAFAEASAVPERLCRDLAAAGFAGARWARSQLFPGEWECSSELTIDGKVDGLGFIVIRGAGKAAIGSLMLKLNPAVPDDCAFLAVQAERVFVDVLARSGILLPQDFYRRIEDWEIGDVVSSVGRVRIAAQHGTDRRIISLSVLPTLPAPAKTCGSDCRRWMQMEAATSGTKREMIVADR